MVKVTRNVLKRKLVRNDSFNATESSTDNYSNALDRLWVLLKLICNFINVKVSQFFMFFKPLRVRSIVNASIEENCFKLLEMKNNV